MRNPRILIHLSQTVPDGQSRRLVVITDCSDERTEDSHESYLSPETVQPCPKALSSNGGAALTVEGSELLDDPILAEKGTDILHLPDFYGLKGSLAVGRTAGMKEIVERMHREENTLIL